MPKPKRTAARADDCICIQGAREHNLKNLSLSLPRNQFVVITGVSGSGKSTLAFDLLFAEGQRRFLDCMNAYARQFIEQMPRPDVDLITGIPPSVSIEQRNTRGGGKSTVATVTEVYHFLRLLFARLGTQVCPDCQVPVTAQSRDQVGQHLKAELARRGDLLLLAPVIRNRKGFHTEIADWAAKNGYSEIRADGKMHPTSKPFRLDRFKEHDVEIVIGVLDRPPARRAPSRKTPRQLIDEALDIGQGTLFALGNDGAVSVHSIARACPRCGKSYQPLDPKNFSYNSAQGWCPRCRGFGELFYLPEVDRGARADSIEESWFEWQSGDREICPLCQGNRLNAIARAVRLDLGRASEKAPAKRIDRRAPTIDAVSRMPVRDASAFFRSLRVKGREAEIARDILPEIVERLRFLEKVGLGYLELGRGATTLSGGETQRIRLAAQLGSNLSGVLYVLDEPTIGLHPHDNEQLLSALAALKARGNSLVVVEHDDETMRHADYIIDLGPGAGIHGGQVVACGNLQELMRQENSLTGQFLRAPASYPTRGQRRSVARPGLMAGGRQSAGLASAESAGFLTLHGASKNNLKNLTVTFPLGRLILVTGVSGSGKSTLVRECLLPSLQEALRRKKASAPNPALCRLTGSEAVKSVYEVDQSPIGRTPRSIPATYVGFFDEIRRLFSMTPEARLRGYTPSRFSFNSPAGRCPTCEGAGTVKLEMSFMPPAFVKCESCAGLRYNRETLDIQLRGLNIAQALDLSVEEAIPFFSSFRKILRALEALRDTGLDYLKLGQISPTLSGGEAQRLKLVTHLLTGLREIRENFQAGAAGPKPGGQSSPSQPNAAGRSARPALGSLFILEEPTIGLHMADVRRLAEVLQRLVDAGNTVMVIEHNLELIAEADWILDLGPEGGGGGGRIVAEGTPEQVARNKRSRTGQFLRRFLANSCPSASRKF